MNTNPFTEIEKLSDFCSEHCHETWCAEHDVEFTEHIENPSSAGEHCSQCYELIGNNDAWWWNKEITTAELASEIDALTATIRDLQEQLNKGNNNQ